MIGIPAFSVRVSTRAKKVRLEVSARNGVVVVVPKGFDQAQIPALVGSKRSWIEKALERIRQERGSRVQSVVHGLPRCISLLAIGEEWAVQSQSTEAMRVAAIEKTDRLLVLRGSTDDTAASARALQRWIHRKAHKHLVPWLQRISEEEGLPFGRTLVKSQRTRWGSCSRRQTISINRNLLFVPRHLVDYVFIHELCHTVHPNHSGRFWKLVGEKEPNYLVLRKELRTAQRWIPDWVADGHANMLTPGNG